MARQTDMHIASDFLKTAGLIPLLAHLAMVVRDRPQLTALNTQLPTFNSVP